jgi:hypothetical protein
MSITYARQPLLFPSGGSGDTERGMTMATYRVRVPATVELIYEVEADTRADAKSVAQVMAETGDLPTEFESTHIGTAKIEKQEVA